MGTWVIPPGMLLLIDQNVARPRASGNSLPGRKEQGCSARSRGGSLQAAVDQEQDGIHGLGTASGSSQPSQVAFPKLGNGRWGSPRLKRGELLLGMTGCEEWSGGENPAGARAGSRDHGQLPRLPPAEGWGGGCCWIGNRGPTAGAGAAASLGMVEAGGVTPHQRGL